MSMSNFRWPLWEKYSSNQKALKYSSWGTLMNISNYRRYIRYSKFIAREVFTLQCPTLQVTHREFFLKSTRNKILFTNFRLIWIQTASVRFQINRKMVNTIWCRVHLIWFQEDFLAWRDARASMKTIQENLSLRIVTSEKVLLYM